MPSVSATKRFDGAAVADAYSLQVTLGDAAVADNSWALDEWAATADLVDDL